MWTTRASRCCFSRQTRWSMQLLFKARIVQAKCWRLRVLTSALVTSSWRFTASVSLPCTAATWQFVGCLMMPRHCHRTWTRARSSLSRRLTERDGRQRPIRMFRAAVHRLPRTAWWSPPKPARDLAAVSRTSRTLICCRWAACTG